MHGFGDAPASWAGIARLRAVHVQFVGDAVLPGIRAFVDVTVVANHAEEMLYAFLVPVFRGADEVVVRNPHPVPEFSELGRNFIRILLRSFACGLRGALDLLTMLVGAGQKK